MWGQIQFPAVRSRSSHRRWAYLTHESEISHLLLHQPGSTPRSYGLLYPAPYSWTLPDRLLLQIELGIPASFFFCDKASFFQTNKTGPCLARSILCSSSWEFIGDVDVKQDIRNGHRSVSWHSPSARHYDALELYTLPSPRPAPRISSPSLPCTLWNILS